MSRAYRILLLLCVLAIVAGLTLGERYWVRTWSQPLRVTVYPIAMDTGSQAYLARLLPDDFQPITHFLEQQAQRWQPGSVSAPRLVLKPALRSPPPTARVENMFDAMLFSLRLRAYAFWHTGFWENLGGVRLFLLYHQAVPGQALPHSLGLEKGLLGVVHVFADDAQTDQNNVIIAHELLHTLGARDKYDARGMPMYPAGYAEPYEKPRHPQRLAEIMGGRIPLDPERASIPESLEDTVIGYATAAEIGLR
jgi:hypothetical protein